jgi:hypothetical protein
MEYESDESQGSFFDRMKESPRTVSAIIIILIVAAAIYAFSGRQDQTTEEQLTPSGEVTEESAATASPEPTDMAAMTEPKEMTKSLPAGERSQQGFIETAQPGDGITHLARRAATRYLSENDPGFQVTSEHRVYIEDYIKDRTGREGLKIGETKTISTDLIKEAVTAAQALNDRQLQNLSQYTSALK